ncbi:hypothetical protein PC121_g7789 [Phytophthora cactorum]|nr:hypothetical protein PC121_g7789 [Phytophthora cactorum]
MMSAYAISGTTAPLPRLSPSSAEQRVLESFLLEMDVSDFDLDSLKHDKRVNTKRKAGTPAHPCTKKPPLSCERRKHDLQRLRAEVEALQAHKKKLELRRVDGGLQRASEDQNPWRNTAAIEKRRCQQANDENTRLKRKLQHCVKTYDGMKTMVDASLAEGSIASTLLDQTRLECRHVAGPMMFSVLENRLNKRLEDLGSVYVASSASEVGTDFDQVQVHREGEAQGATALEFNRSRLLPFTPNTTSDTVWNVMKLGVISNRCCARVYIRSKDLLASQGCFTHRLDDGGSVDIRICCLVKRVETPEGFMVLIESITEWLARPSCSREWRHVTRDSGWVAVRPVATTTATTRLCQLQLAMRLQTNESVKITDNKSDSLLLARSVSDVMVTSFRSILNSRHQLIDNALLDSQ